jgi:ATP-dependent protease Clp ATPase subunit
MKLFGLGRTQAPEGLPHCDFCNKSSDEVRALVAGPKQYICDECVAICVDIIRYHQERVPEDQPASESTMEAPCVLCKGSSALKEMLLVEQRGLLCNSCLGAIEAATARPSATGPNQSTE